MSSIYTITATGTGTTDAVALPSGSSWALQITCSSWGVASIESSADGGTTFTTVDYADTAISLTGNKTYVVVGGLKYRLNVSSYSAAITMTCQPVST